MNNDAKDDLTEARGNDALRNALKPFANAAQFWADIPEVTTHPNCGLWQDSQAIRRCGLTVGDLRAAAAAIDALAAPQINAPALPTSYANLHKAAEEVLRLCQKLDSVAYPGWFDAIENLITAINAPAGTPALPSESDSNVLGHETHRSGEVPQAPTP